jgi:hypothetical protein
MLSHRKTDATDAYSVALVASAPEAETLRTLDTLAGLIATWAVRPLDQARAAAAKPVAGYEVDIGRIGQIRAEPVRGIGNPQGSGGRLVLFTVILGGGQHSVGLRNVVARA